MPYLHQYEPGHLLLLKNVYVNARLKKQPCNRQLIRFFFFFSTLILSSEFKSKIYNQNKLIINYYKL